MERLRFDIADSAIPKDGSERLELSVLVSAGVFSFFIFDDKNRIRALKSWQLDFTNGTDFQARRLSMARIVGSQPVLGGQFTRCTCRVSNPWVSLVPDKVFDETRLPAYLHLLMEADRAKFSFFSEKLPGMPIRLISFPNSQRASYSRKPVGFTIGRDSYSAVFGDRTGSGFGNM